MANTNFYNLDIDDIKTDIKSFFASSTEFEDYNFEGSAISQLLDVMAYSTQYLAFYLNQTVNDLTLANSELSVNVRKLANMLNYLPKRKSAPYISVTLQRSDTYTIIIPKYSTWEMGSLTLTNVEDITISDDNEHDIYLYEGIPTTELFTSDGTEFQVFTLENTENVDDTYFHVYVDEDPLSPSSTPWLNSHSDDFEFESNGYYIQYFDDFTIKFDNGRLFNYPNDGDQIRVEYIYTNGTTYNGTTGTITITDTDATNIEYLDITVNGSLENGTDEETTEEIKSRAPLFYTSQGRAVTAGDYNNLIKRWSEYAILDSAIAWGGEEEYIDILDSDKIVETSDDKDLGYVYISALLSDQDYITDQNWSDLEDFLGIYKFVNLFFKFLDPVFVNVSPTVNYQYQSIVGVSEDIEALVNAYLDTKEGYEASFYLSDLIGFVDDLQSVVYCDISYTTSFTARHDADTDYKVIRLNGEITASSVTGTVNSLTLADDGAGNMTWNSGNVGTINYDTGFIILDTDFGGLSDETEYEITFEYADTNYIITQKETYLKFEDISAVLI